ncbi:hypothetical protein [Rhodobacter capsulatus]|uniref:hypothetical protein n=1 Tax=Rhodobacter capsulatus TaxID=1061 RepID=UPI004028C03D
MKHYAIYKDTQILRTGQCPDDLLEMQALAGEYVIEHDGSICDDTHYIKNGEFREYPPRPSDAHIFNSHDETWFDPRTIDQIAAELVAYRLRAFASVNRHASDARKRYITDIAGQDMLYLRKEAEAAAFLKDTAPDLQMYPLIAAEIGITGQDAFQIAQIWLNMSAIWIEKAAEIEAIRLGYIAQINTSDEKSQIDQFLIDCINAFSSI